MTPDDAAWRDAAPAAGPTGGLRALADCGGCAAKAPAALVALLASVAATADAPDAVRLLVGLAPPDDAAVYPLDAERALVATVDFFPPIVDDPEDYGAIAAANAVSDVYAMGGSVALALALSGFPGTVPAETVAAVNRAAGAVVAACGGAIVGGHSIRCREPVFGLCVLGFVHPARIWQKSGARPGDALLISKPLGTGLLVSSREAPALRTAVGSMRRTNQQAAAALQALPAGPHAVTDVSGFGLLGHALEMARRSAVALRIELARLPLLEGARAAADAGVRTSAHRAAPDRDAAVQWQRPARPTDVALLRDPQTSGGLLAAVAPRDVPALEAAGFVRIGSVEAGTPGVVID